MPRIRRVVIFGDSLSDIGNMHHRAVVRHGATINGWGRFSDARNWVDYFWERISQRTMFLTDNKAQTITNSDKHRSLRFANHEGNGMELVNYAEGGSLAWGDTSTIPRSIQDQIAGRFVLNNVRHQTETYIEEVRSYPVDFDRVPPKETLYIMWAGANDIVTVHRPPDVMQRPAQEMFALARDILESGYLSGDTQGPHVLLIDLPDPQYMPKFENAAEATRRQFAVGAETFNSELNNQFTQDIVSEYFNRNQSTLNLFGISELLTPAQVADAGFAPISQSRWTWGNVVRSVIGRSRVERAPLLAYEDIGIDETSQFGTTRDRLHPTEGVYRLIATHIADYCEQRLHFEWGHG